MPNAAAIAAIQNRHRFERTQLHDAHRNQHDHLRMLQPQSRDRAREEATARRSQPLKHAGSHASVRVPDDDADLQDRVKAHAELDARQRRERDEMTARHKREIDAERARPGSSAGADRNSGPSGPGALGAVWDQLSGAQQADYHALKRKFEVQRKALEAKQSETQQRHARYSHARMTAQDQEAREAEHRRLNEEEERAIEVLRRKFEHELDIARHRRQRQPDERRVA